MTIFLASDHGGYKMKDFLFKALTESGYEVFDMGPHVFNPADDYPAFSREVAKAVVEEPGSLGILLCRSGQGVCIAANKVNGVRAVLAWNGKVAVAGRRDDHANILCLPSDYLSEEEILGVAKTWLTTEPGKEERYLRRIKEIEAIEKSL